MKCSSESLGLFGCGQCYGSCFCVFVRLDFVSPDSILMLHVKSAKMKQK